MSEAHTIILVYSTSYALKIEKLFQQTGIISKLVPVPRHLSTDCGVCVRIDQYDRKRAETLIRSAEIETEGFFDI